jgi:hypothetical protein
MTQRPGDLAGAVIRAPRPVPAANALLQVGDNLAGDAAVNITDFGHGLVQAWVTAAAATLPVGETGGSKRKEAPNADLGLGVMLGKTPAHGSLSFPSDPVGCSFGKILR